MRFAYSPETGVFSVYATPEEFALAHSSDDENPEKYRVIVKQMRNKDGSNNEVAIYDFIHEYVNFVKKIFGDLYPDEKIKDVVVLSTMPKLGYTWTSLLDLENFDSSQNFLELMTSYAFKTIADTGVNKKSGVGKELMEMLSETDFAKLTLAKMILCSIQHPTVWNKKQKSDKQKEQLEANLKTVETKIKKYEKKYGFDSAEMQKYYGDDKYPEKDMQDWLKLYTDASIIRLSLEKYELVENLVTQWRDSFEVE